MDSLRRTLVLSLPAVALGGLHGCGGAESNSAQDMATAQSTGETSAQKESIINSGSNFSIRNRSGSNFPLRNGSFELGPQPQLIQAVINTGSPGGMGPVLALQLSAMRAAGTNNLVAEVSLSVKLGDIVPTETSIYSLGSGGSLASDGLITCRQISTDGTVASYAYRIVAGNLVVSKVDLAGGSVILSLQDIIANAAVGFNNSAQGSIALQTNAPATVRTVLENSGTQLS